MGEGGRFCETNRRLGNTDDKKPPIQKIDGPKDEKKSTKVCINERHGESILKLYINMTTGLFHRPAGVFF